MFKLSMVSADLVHINLRDEKHGEESVPCTDLKFVADVPQSFLTQLDPALLEMLYKPEGESPGEQAPLITGDGHMPLRFPKLPRLAWAAAPFSAEVVLHAPKKKDEYRAVGSVDKLVLEPKEGGPVTITFRVSVTGTTPADVAHIVARKGMGDLSVSPAVEDHGAADDGGGEGDGGGGGDDDNDGIE